MATKFTPMTMNLVRGVEFPIFRSCLNKVVLFENGKSDILGDTFPEAHTIIFDGCDKEFIRYNVKRQKFPVAQLAIFNPHPYDVSVLHPFFSDPRFEANFTTGQAGDPHPHMHIMRKESYDAFLESFDFEMAVFE